MTTYAVGDLQGCLRPLRKLLDKINFDPAADRLWLCGDLINRGPASLDTLRLARELAAAAVLGNHDLTLLAVAAGRVEPRRKDTLREILDAPDRDELLGWLRRLPLLHHDALLGYTMVHAGFAPQWDLALARRCAAEVEAALRDDAGFDTFMGAMFGNAPARWDDTLQGFERLRASVNCFTRMRFCYADGTLDLREKGPPGSQPQGSGLLPWFQVPGRRSAGLNIVFGHWATLGYYHEPGIDALDSGCVWGGRLTALRLDGERAGTTLSVGCKKRL